MKVYETIISILEDKGPLSIPSICSELNQMLDTPRDKPVLPSQIKSIVSRKKDLFHIMDGNISIKPDKQPLFLIFILDGNDGITYQVNVNFTNKRFTYFEWRCKGKLDRKNARVPNQPGDIDEFKRAIFALKWWKWLPAYGKKEGIVIGPNWSFQIKTKSKMYKSEGVEGYPENWTRFCKAVEKLTGLPFE